MPRTPDHSLSLKSIDKCLEFFGFGDKTGERLYSLAGGIDRDAIQWDSVNHQAKSISAGCSFGVRFTPTAKVNTFIKQLSTELSKRATESECYGKKITLSLWVVRKGFINEPVKPGAHGVVAINSRSRPFHIPTRDVTVISKMSSELVRSITKTSIPPNYVRGVRISLENLVYEGEMTGKEKKSVQRTIESAFSAKRPQKLAAAWAKALIDMLMVSEDLIYQNYGSTLG